jgi:hypothetical protein
MKSATVRMEAVKVDGTKERRLVVFGWRLDDGITKRGGKSATASAAGFWR